MNDNLLTPVGQIVQGHPMDEKTKDRKGNILKTTKGEPRSEWFFALAVRKTEPLLGQIWKRLQEAAIAGFPGGEHKQSDFSWKYLDGDKPENKSKTGFSGCYIFRFAGGFAPEVYLKGGKTRIDDKRSLKCGDYVRTYFSTKGNRSDLSPGIYLNPLKVEIIGYGDEIVSGPSGEEIFGQDKVDLPPGAKPVNTSASNATDRPPEVVSEGPPGSASQVNTPPGQVSTATDTTPMPPGSVDPAPDFLTGPKMTLKAGSTPYADFIEKGWTDKTLREHGYMEYDDIPY